MAGRFLPGVPGPQVEAAYHAAPGNEIENGKFDSAESSSALAANTFGFFLNRPENLPPVPGCEHEEWPATAVALEQTMSFPWRRGRHPVLDVLLTTSSALMGIESKRFEPFRDRPRASFSPAFWRDVWGDRMNGYQSVRDKLREDESRYTCLKADQLVKHALGLRTRSSPGKVYAGLVPILIYLYAEPDFLPNTRKSIDEAARATHRVEVEAFAEEVAGDEVRFVACTYRDWLANWKESGAPEIRAHAEAVLQRFSP